VKVGRLGAAEMQAEATTTQTLSSTADWPAIRSTRKIVAILPSLLAFDELASHLVCLHYWIHDTRDYQ
jgi:hypothetical protein